MKKAFILLIVFSLSVHRVYAQEICSIYRIALDSLYKAELNVLIHEQTQEKIDPYSECEVPNGRLIEMQAPYMMFIEKELIIFYEHWAIPWVQKVINKKQNLRQQKFYVHNNDSRLKCEDFGANFCYELISSRQSDTFNYSSVAYCPTKDAILPYKKKVRLSQLVFSNKQNIAVVFFEIKQRRGRGDEEIWVFTLVRKNEIWSIHSCDKSRG
mgnify:CR=1 FL=1